MLVGRHDLFHRGKNLLLLLANGESIGQQDGLFSSLPKGLYCGPHPIHRRVKFTLSVRFFGKAHVQQQCFQLRVCNSGQMSVRVHRQDQKIKKRVLLLRRKFRGLIVHVAKIADSAAN